MNEFTRVMKALSDQNRVKIIKMLQLRSLCVCEIREALGIAQPTASKHLKVLEEAGLITKNKDGLWVNYLLSDGSATPYAASLLGNLKHWLEDSPEFSEIKKRLPFISRESICK